MSSLVKSVGPNQEPTSAHITKTTKLNRNQVYFLSSLVMAWHCTSLKTIFEVHFYLMDCWNKRCGCGRRCQEWKWSDDNDEDKTDLHVDGTPDYLQLFQHQHQHHVGPKKSFLKVTDRSFHAILIHHTIIYRVEARAVCSALVCNTIITPQLPPLYSMHH